MPATAAALPGYLILGAEYSRAVPPVVRYPVLTKEN